MYVHMYVDAVYICICLCKADLISTCNTVTVLSAKVISIFNIAVLRVNDADFFLKSLVVDLYQLQ
jgi:hypothetical protein